MVLGCICICGSCSYHPHFGRIQSHLASYSEMLVQVFVQTIIIHPFAHADGPICCLFDHSDVLQHSCWSSGCIMAGHAGNQRWYVERVFFEDHSDSCDCLLGSLCRVQGMSRCCLVRSLTYEFYSSGHGNRKLLWGVLYSCNYSTYLSLAGIAKKTVCFCMSLDDSNRMEFIAADRCALTALSYTHLKAASASIPLALRSSRGAAYGPDGLICGIRSIFPKLQFFLHLLPVSYNASSKSRYIESL